MYFRALLLFFIVTLLSSCDPNRVYEENKEIPDGIWYKAQKVPFEVSITDTGLKYNLYLNIRHTSGFPYRNIWMKVYTTYPSGKQRDDLAELILAEQDGKWRGSGMGDIWDNSILIQRNIKFPEPGSYKFELEHYMRHDKLPFVMDVGVRVEKVD
ncbi:MAG: gliding motility lipoprotein GldH [Bacteroidia bacterium]|nr:gliding motility lipoprotein GldH [Bacteroidia bacterium]